jgi:hypothetical protein
MTATVHSARSQHRDVPGVDGHLEPPGRVRRGGAPRRRQRDQPVRVAVEQQDRGGDGGDHGAGAGPAAKQPQQRARRLQEGSLQALLALAMPGERDGGLHHVDRDPPGVDAAQGEHPADQLLGGAAPLPGEVALAHHGDGVQQELAGHEPVEPGEPRLLAGSTRTAPATVEGAAVACSRVIRPPIELPTRIAGPPTTSWRKRSSSRRLAWTVAGRPAGGVRP